jgi:hypothetical protein
MPKGNYRVQVTLNDATLDDAGVIVNELAQDFDLSIDEFDVEVFEQKDDETWESIGTLYDPDA